MTTPAPNRPDIFTAKFSTGDLAKAADVTTAALQTWIRRGLIVGADGTGIDMPGQAGIRRAFTFGQVIEVAIGAAMLKNTVFSPSQAFRAARVFAYTGTEGRRPGVPFRDGFTLLCVDGDRAVVLHIAESETVAEMNRSLRAAEGYYTLFANMVFDRAVSALGWHPEEVLEAAYSEART